MGCDIHMYLEYTEKGELEKYEKGERFDIHGNPVKPYWRSFGSELNPGRDYGIFGFLSNGVRSIHTEGFPRKGLPPFDELSYTTRNDSVMYITEKGDGENEVTLERALSWVGNNTNKLHYGSNTDKPLWVDNPDWHSHSWLTMVEYEEALKRYVNYYSEYEGDIKAGVEYTAILALMKHLEENGYVTRIVFWFDN